MKRKNLILTAFALSGLLALSSCASLSTPQASFPDDVYGRAAVARPLPEAPRYERNDQYQDEQDTYYDDNQYYNDSYVDGYQDGYYANRLNRFYYYTPGMSYYDPFFDPWIGYSPYGYGRFSFGFGWGSSWYSPYYSSFYSGWGFPYSSWGPYSYYDRFGYGYYGHGYGYGNYYPGVITTKTIRTRPSNLATDNIGSRSTRPSRGTVSAAGSSRNVRPSGAQGTRPSRTEGVTSRPTQSRPTQQSTRPSRTERTTPRQTQPQSRPAPTNTRPTRSEGTTPRQTQPQSRPATQSRPAPSSTTTRPARTSSAPAVRSAPAPSRATAPSSSGSSSRSSRSR